MGSAAIMDAGPARRRRSNGNGDDVEVIVHDRAYDAHQLRLTGLDWPEIAGRVGYLDGRIASMAVTAFLQKTAAEQAHDHRRQALHLELARLDQLQSAFYPAAMAGDIAAANVVLKVINRRCSVMGFDKVDDDLTGTARTIVVGGNSEEYIASLKSLIGDSDSPDPLR
jgi:hypothetical protein